MQLHESQHTFEPEWPQGLWFCLRTCMKSFMKSNVQCFQKRQWRCLAVNYLLSKQKIVTLQVLGQCLGKLSILFVFFSFLRLSKGTFLPTHGELENWKIFHWKIETLENYSSALQDTWLPQVTRGAWTVFGSQLLGTIIAGPTRKCLFPWF